MAFKRMLPRKGTVIPEGHRPHGSTNAALHELPAYREHTHDLIGVVLYLPRLKFIVVPFRLVSSGGAGCVIIEGDKTYPRGGYDIDVSDWELQRAERVALCNVKFGDLAATNRELRALADGRTVWIDVEQSIVVGPDPVCVRCGVWLNQPDKEISYTDTYEGPVCDGPISCADRQGKRGDVYRAPVRS